MKISESLQANVAKSLLNSDWLSDQMIAKSIADWLIKSVYNDTPVELKDFRLEFRPEGRDALLQPFVDAVGNDSA